MKIGCGRAAVIWDAKLKPLQYAGRFFAGNLFPSHEPEDVQDETALDFPRKDGLLTGVFVCRAFLFFRADFAVCLKLSVPENGNFEVF